MGRMGRNLLVWNKLGPQMNTDKKKDCLDLAEATGYRGWLGTGAEREAWRRASCSVVIL